MSMVDSDRLLKSTNHLELMERVWLDCKMEAMSAFKDPDRYGNLFIDATEVVNGEEIRVRRSLSVYQFVDFMINHPEFKAEYLKRTDLMRELTMELMEEDMSDIESEG